MPLVSVVTPVYNSAGYIEKTVDSVLSQTFDDWEMILVDDASTDNSAEIAGAFVERDSRIQLIRLSERSGAAVARNAAIEAAGGRYIAFLDGDDLWMPRKLEKQIAFMRRNGYAFTCTNYEKIAENGESLGQVVKPPPVITYNDILKTCRIGCLTAVYDSQAVGKVTMPLIRKRQDYGLWLRILRQGVVAHCLNETLAKYRVRRDSVSANKFDLPRYHWTLYRHEERLSVWKSGYYVACYTLNNVLSRLRANFG